MNCKRKLPVGCLEVRKCVPKCAQGKRVRNICERDGKGLKTGDSAYMDEGLGIGLMTTNSVPMRQKIRGRYAQIWWCLLASRNGGLP